MRYERIYIQYNDLVFDGYGMLGEYDASSVSFKVTTHARSFGHGSYAPFKSPNAFVDESSVSLTLWLKEKKLPCEVRPFYRSFVIEQLSKHGKLWAVQDNTLVWAYATVQSYSEMVEHANGKLGIDVDFLLYEGVWHKADKQKTFLHPYDLCTFMDCFDYKEYQPCDVGMHCCSEIDILPQTTVFNPESDTVTPAHIRITDSHDLFESLVVKIHPYKEEGTDYSSIERIGSVSVNIGSTPTESNPKEYSAHFISSGITVYSGEIDMVTGLLISDSSKYVASNLTWVYDNDSSTWISSDLQSIIEIPESSGYASRIMSSFAKTLSFDDLSSATKGIAVDEHGNIVVKKTNNSTPPSGDILIPLRTPEMNHVKVVSVSGDLVPEVGDNYITSFEYFDLPFPLEEFSYATITTTGYHRDPCFSPMPENDKYCCECDCDELTQDMALCYHLDDLQDVYKDCSNAGFRVIYDCEAAERFFNIIGQRICTDVCSNGTIAGKIYSETDIPTTGINITIVGKMHNPYVEINGNGNWIAGDYDGRLRIESNGDVYFENGCKCDTPLPPDVWQKPIEMNYGWTIVPRYNRVVINLGACCGKACAYFDIDNLTI